MIFRALVPAAMPASPCWEPPPLPREADDGEDSAAACSARGDLVVNECSGGQLCDGKDGAAAGYGAAAAAVAGSGGVWPKALPGMLAVPRAPDSPRHPERHHEELAPSERSGSDTGGEVGEHVHGEPKGGMSASFSTRSRSGLRSLLHDKLKTREYTFDEVVALKKTRKEQEANICVLLPGSPFLTAWRATMTFAVLWAVSVTPVELAFSWWKPPIGIVAAARFVDAACVVDMFVNFNAAKLEHGRLVYDRRQIAKGYLKSWFIVDLLTNFPWDLLFSNGKSRKVAKILKLPKLLRVIRLLRVAQEEAYYFGSIFSVAIILYLAHCFSCLWAWLLIDCAAKDQHDSEGCPEILPAYFAGLSVGLATIAGADGWMRFAIASAGSYGGGEELEVEVEPGHTWSHSPRVVADVAASFTVVLGFCALAMLFANVAHTIGKTGAHAMAFNERLSNLKAASHQHPIPHELFKRVKKHFHYVWSCGSDASRALLRDSALTVDLRRQLALCFYGHSLRLVPFLADSEEGFLKQLCERVEMECFSPMDRIIVAGEMGTELYFLVVGRMRIELPQGGQEMKKLHEGSFFGEMGLLFPGTARTVSVIAETFGWVLIIDRISLEEICTEELLDTFRCVAKERFEKNPGAGVRRLPMDQCETAPCSEEDEDPARSFTLPSPPPARCLGADSPGPAEEQVTAQDGPGRSASGTARPLQAWVARRSRTSTSSSSAARRTSGTRHSKDHGAASAASLHSVEGQEAAIASLALDVRELAGEQRAGLAVLAQRLGRLEAHLALASGGGAVGSVHDRDLHELPAQFAISIPIPRSANLGRHHAAD